MGNDRPIQVHQQRYIGGRVQQRSRLGLALPQLLLRPPAPRYVAGDHSEPHDLPVGVKHGVDTLVEPSSPALVLKTDGLA